MTDRPTMTPDEAVAWIAGIFEERDGLTLATPREEIPYWDSMGVLSLLAALDERFGIVLGNDDVKSMRSVGDIVEAMRRQGAIA